MRKMLLGLSLFCGNFVMVHAQSAGGNPPKTEKPTPAPATAPVTGPPAISFLADKDNTHNLSSFAAGKPKSYDFVFTNTGKGPLLVTGATSEFERISMEWPKAAIAPGGTGIIKVTHDGTFRPKPGTRDFEEFDQTISVASNAGDPVTLRIKGTCKTVPRN